MQKNASLLHGPHKDSPNDNGSPPRANTPAVRGTGTARRAEGGKASKLYREASAGIAHHAT